jgi:hypothetical protein
MGHEATSRVSQQRGSAMGAQYRHTTPPTWPPASRQRSRTASGRVLEVAEQALEAHHNCSTHRVF